MKKYLLSTIVIIFTVFINTLQSQSFITTIDELQMYSGNDYVHVKGFYEEGDSGGGHFILKKSTLPTNGGTIFNSSSNDPNDKWFRVYDGPINVKWFGAKGNGTSYDDANIQMAIDALSNTGGEIKISSGIYKLDKLIKIENKHHIKILLEKNTILLTKKHGYGILEISDSQNIEIEGGIFSGAENFLPNKDRDHLDGGGEKHYTREEGKGWGYSRNDDSGHIIDDPKYNNVGNAGIGILIRKGSENININNVELKGFNYSGIQVQFLGDSEQIQKDFCKGVRIKDSFIHDIYGAGISIHGSTDVIVTRNYIKNIGHPDAKITDLAVDPGYGITIRGIKFSETSGKNIIVSNNNFINCKRKGIDAHSGENLIISNNTIEGSIVCGICTQIANLGEGETTTITDNVIINSGIGFTRSANTGILNNFPNSIIKGNILKNSGYSFGIMNTGKNTLIDANNIYINQQSGNDFVNGIYLQNTEFIKITNNNVIAETSIELYAGLQLDNVKRSLVKDNQFNIKKYKRAKNSALLMVGSNNIKFHRNQWNSVIFNDKNEGEMDTDPLEFGIEIEYNGTIYPSVTYFNIIDDEQLIGIKDTPGGRGHAIIFPRYFYAGLDLSKINVTVERIIGGELLNIVVTPTYSLDKLALHISPKFENSDIIIPADQINNQNYRINFKIGIQN